MLSQTSLARVWGPACTGQRATISLHGRGKVTVRVETIEAVKALNQLLIKWNYQTRAHDTGAYVCRKKVSGDGWSNHSYGTAIDINWLSNPYGSRLVTNMPLGMPRDICQIRTNNGKQVWNWGGYWRGSKDAMHYEIVCAPADLRTGINWRTVGGGIATPPPTVPRPPVKVEEPKKEEKKKMAVVIQHHNNETWLHDGLWRTRLNYGPTNEANSARENYWAFVNGTAIVDLKKNAVLSQMHLDQTTDTNLMHQTRLVVGQNNSWLSKLLGYFKIPK